MELLIFFLGTIFGSFYNVVAERITNKKSIVHPPSHCPKCQHILKWWELIPVISFLLQGAKCSNCKVKLSWFYPLSEIVSGLLFVICFLVFGFSLELIIALTFVSMLIIIVLSDLYYMIIEDCVLIFFGIAIFLQYIFIYDIKTAFIYLLYGVGSFVLMLGLKFLGDFLFKKESLGGGDIKLMLVIGMVIGFDMSIMTIFLSAFLALPISLLLIKSENHEIPYGPFLALAALIIYFFQIDMNIILNFLNNLY